MALETGSAQVKSHWSKLKSTVFWKPKLIDRMGKMVLISSLKVFVEADAWVWVLVTWTFSGFIAAWIASFLSLVSWTRAVYAYNQSSGTLLGALIFWILIEVSNVTVDSSPWRSGNWFEIKAEKISQMPKQCELRKRKENRSDDNFSDENDTSERKMSYILPFR